MQVITSKENENIKEIRKLKDKKYRDEKNEFVVEGIKMIQEAINENAKIKVIVVCDDCTTSGTIPNELLYEIAKFNCLYVNEKIFNLLTNVTNPQGILAVIEKESQEEKINFNENVILILDDIQDPGNMGTIIRTVDSIGLSQVLVSKDSADCYNPKVVRSTMGAIFRVKVIECENIIKTIKEVKKHKYKVYATSLATDKSIYDVNFEKSAIIIGNEANGVSGECLENSDEKIKIPMQGKTESLNAAVATSVILYESLRQSLKK